MTRTVHPTAGGSTKYFYEVAQELKKQGHHITLICSDRQSNHDTNVDNLVFIKEIPIPIIGRLYITTLFGLIAFLKVRREIFNVYCFESGYMGIWAILFRLAGKKPIVSFSMRYGWSFIKLNLFKKDMLKKRNFIPDLVWEMIFSLNEVIDVYLSNHVIVLSSEAKKLWINKRIATSKIEVIPYGVNLHIYRPIEKDDALLRELGIGKNDKVILFVGHLDPIRNPDIVIKAFSISSRKLENANSRKNLKLIIVGSGPLEGSLKQLVNELKLENSVKFLVHIHDEVKLNKIYNLGTLMILPSVPGTAAIQATACGLPVITIRNNSGLLGAIDTRILDNFILLDSTHPEVIAERCHEILNAPERLNSISINAQEIIKDYSWETIAKQLDKMLITLASQKPSSI